MGETKKKLFELFEKVKIKDSEIKSVVGDVYLPDYIKIEGGDIFKIRTKRKVLCYSEYEEGTEEYEHGQVKHNSFI